MGLTVGWGIFGGETLFFLYCVAFFSKAKVGAQPGEPQKKKSCLKPETSMYKCFLHNQETWQPDGVPRMSQKSRSGL